LNVHHFLENFDLEEQEKQELADEKAALKAVLDFAHIHLNVFDTFLEEDQRILHDLYHPFNRNPIIINAILIRVQEKRLLNYWIDAVEKYLNFLNMPWQEAEMVMAQEANQRGDLFHYFQSWSAWKDKKINILEQCVPCGNRA